MSRLKVCLSRSAERRLGNERGNAMVFVVMSLTVLLGVAALAIDLGVASVARGEAQGAADAGAHAGGSVFLYSPGNVDLARTEAEAFAEANPVRFADLDVLPDEDIQVVPDSQKVRVRVHRTEERGNPIATFFARALGINTIDIGAVAAAQSWPSDATDCILPFAIPDHWYVNAPGVGLRPATASDTWDEARGDLYIPASNPDANGFYTGYGVNRIGQEILLKPGAPSGSPQPGWYYAIRLPGSSGGADYRYSIANCWEEAGEHELGDEVQKEPGNMSGPTNQGFNDVINQEPGAVWDVPCKCPRSADGGILGSESPRVRPLIMFDPRDWPDIQQGAHSVPITGFAGVFIDRKQGSGNVWVRWMVYQGVHTGPEWEPGNGTLLRLLRIVE